MIKSKEDLMGTPQEYLTNWFIEPFEAPNSFTIREKIDKIDTVSRQIIPAIAEFPESVKDNRTGAIITVSNREFGLKPVAITINEEDKPDAEFGTKPTKHLAYSLAKNMYSIQNPSSYGSSDNTRNDNSLNINGNPVPAGSISWGGWNISVSGFNPAQIDEGTALAIHVGIGNMQPHVAHAIAVETNNRHYLENEDNYLEPIYH